MIVRLLVIIKNIPYMLLTVLKLNTVQLPISSMLIYNFILKLVVRVN